MKLDRKMTLPHERFRAIRWGGELLQAMQSDDTVSAELKSMAKAIAVNYPSDATLRDHLAREEADYPNIWLVAIDDAEQLFQKLRFSPDQGTAETRTHLRYAQRHFPLPGEAKSRGRFRPEDSLLGAWITPDDLPEA